VKFASRRLFLCAALLLAVVLVNAQEPTPPSQPAATSAPTGALTTIHGVVRNAVTGEPLPRALVRIEGESGVSALTDGEGRFELDGVATGPQIIRVRKPGFSDRPYATEDVGYQNGGPAHSVLVAEGMPELNFVLTPTSAIHGHIELSTGDPAEGIGITLLKQVVRNGRAVWAQNGETKTNGSGAYRFAGLPAGVYALFTQPALESEPAAATVEAGAKVVRNGYASVFYPEAREFSGAARIRLAAGEQAEANLLLTLEPFYTVTAKAILPNGKPFEGVEYERGIIPSEPALAVEVLDESGHQLAYSTKFDAQSHTIQADLPNGSYTLLAVSRFISVQLASSRQSEFLWGNVEFSIDGHDVTNLRTPLSTMSGWSIHLRAVRTSGSSASPELQKQVTVTATHAEAPLSENFDADIFAGDAGSDLLELSRFTLGSQWLSTEVNDRSLCVESFSAGGINLAREPLNVALGASPPPMELTLTDNCAKLELALPPILAAFLPGDEPFYTVYVVPDFDTTIDIPPMNMHPSSGATLTVDGLTPGSYHIYVFDHSLRLEYRNPAVLAALPTPGQQVTLTAGSTSGLVLEVPGR
jgi:hypothetical protein